MTKSSENGRETYTARLSFRSSVRNFQKLVTIAKARGWLNAGGRPNISAVLNHIIEQFDASRDVRKLRRKKKGSSRGRRRAQGSL